MFFNYISCISKLFYLEASLTFSTASLTSFLALATKSYYGQMAFFVDGQVRVPGSPIVGSQINKHKTMNQSQGNRSGERDKEERGKERN